MSFRTLTISLLAVCALLVGNPVQAAPPAPELAFSTKTDKKIQQIYFIGENEDYILFTNKSRVFVHDANTGAKLWDDKIPSFTDDGLELIWNDKVYITSMKKGMRCYEVATGKLLWETATELRMSQYTGYFNFKTGFVLQFGKKLMGFDPSNGQVKWTTEKLDFDSKLSEAGIDNVHSIQRETGDRLLVLGGSKTSLVDTVSGNVLGTVELKWDPKNDQPLAYIGDNLVLLAGKDETAMMNLVTGEQIWKVDDDIDPKRGYMAFEHGGKHYAVIMLKKATYLMDLKTGKRVWEKGKEISGNIAYAHAGEDGTLFLMGYQRIIFPQDHNKQSGSHLIAWGLDIATGAVKYGPNYLLYSPMAGPFRGQIYVAAEYLGDYDGAFLFSLIGAGAAIPGSDPIGEKWGKNEKGGEGLMLIEPGTGKVRWRTNFKCYDRWVSEMQKTGEAIEWTPLAAASGSYPKPFTSEDVAYVGANGSLAKVSLSDGKVLWQGPDFGMVSNLTVADGRVFGTVGYNRWSYDNKVGGKGLLKAAMAGVKRSNDVIHKTKRNGFFVLDDASGNVLLDRSNEKWPSDFHLHSYDPDKQMLFLCNDTWLRGVSVKDGKEVFALDMKKQGTGVISAKKGVVWVVTDVDVYHSYTFYSGGGYSMSTTTVTSYETTMEHRAVHLEGGRVLLIAEDGPCLVESGGNVAWKTEWDWNPDKINFAPTVTKKGIVYQFKRRLQYISLADGSTIWETRENPDGDFIINKRQDRIFIIDKKEITAYKM